jgi:hypothetical protein
MFIDGTAVGHNAAVPLGTTGVGRADGEATAVKGEPVGTVSGSVIAQSTVSVYVADESSTRAGSL